MMSKSVLRPAGNQSSEFVGRKTFRRVAKTIAPSVVNIDGPNGLCLLFFIKAPVFELVLTS